MAGVVTATRGAMGGYPPGATGERKSRSPKSIAAIDGDIGLTQCSVHAARTMRPHRRPITARPGRIGRRSTGLSAPRCPGGHPRRHDLALPHSCRPRAPMLPPRNRPLHLSPSRQLRSILSQTIRSLSERGLQVRLCHRHRSRQRRRLGLDEDTVRFISAKKGEPAWLLEWRLAAFRAWREDDRAGMGEGRVPADRLPVDPATIRRRDRRRPRRNPWTRSIPSCCALYEKLGVLRCASARCFPRSPRNVAVDAVFDSVSGGDDLQGTAAARSASSSARSARRCASIPSW